MVNTFLQVLDELRALYLKKSADYGTDEDPIANVRSSEAFGLPAWVGCMIRANDKMFRIQTLAKTGTLKNESVEDSLLDLASYSIIALELYRETKQAAANAATSVNEPQVSGTPLETWHDPRGVDGY